MSARGTLGDPTHKWTVLKIVGNASWDETRRWAAYPPYSGWGEWIGLYDTWEQAYARAYWEATNGAVTEWEVNF